jgi:hypothetical protein
MPNKGLFVDEHLKVMKEEIGGCQRKSKGRGIYI